MTGSCELCTAPTAALLETELAYACYDNHPLCEGHVIVVPKRHVADFFEMTEDEQAHVLRLLNDARDLAQSKSRPDGYNVGINIGKAAGQSRMHVHVHLIPRFAGDVADPAGGVRCVLKAPARR
jgi:diadenosine tetraphosphate (Ap4A) HIT family hydrolase